LRLHSSPLNTKKAFFYFFPLFRTGVLKLDEFIQVDPSKGLAQLLLKGPFPVTGVETAADEFLLHDLDGVNAFLRFCGAFPCTAAAGLACGITVSERYFHTTITITNPTIRNTTSITTMSNGVSSSPCCKLTSTTLLLLGCATSFFTLPFELLKKKEKKNKKKKQKKKKKKLTSLASLVGLEHCGSGQQQVPDKRREWSASAQSQEIAIGSAHQTNDVCPLPASCS
jgi:hypothetical protein